MNGVRRGRVPDVPCYYFDEHVNPEIAKQLRERGIDVLTTQDAGRANQGLDDSDQLAYATSLGRVLVTQELREFGPLAGEQQHSGIIILQKKTSIGKYIEFLATMGLVLELEEMQNRLEYYDW